MRIQQQAPLPQKIGEYEVLRVLGHGTTATVYLAKHPVSQREVAIKVASPEILKNPERGKLYTHLFLNEASLAGKLTHPHIVQIYDAVVSGPINYIVMEYVPGGTLEEYCAPWKLPSLERVIEIIFKCARALDFAFHAGITHRDIKPANILISSMTLESVDIKVTDFGAALVDSPDRTQVSGIGSPAYMSPQQVMELPLDHQTDIYSLGVVMYQLLTGQLPFQANTNYNIVYQIINNEPKPPSSIRPEIPEILDQIVAKAMSKEISGRYATWQEFTHDLAKVFRNKLLHILPEELLPQEFSESEKFDTLRKLSFFSEFSDIEIFEILRFAQWSTVTPETPIMRDGEPGDFFCILIDGELKVSKKGQILGMLASGECFGESTATGKGRQTRSTDISALTEAKIVTIRNESLQNASDTCRMHFYQAFLDVTATRLSLANARLSTL